MPERPGCARFRRRCLILAHHRSDIQSGQVRERGRSIGAYVVQRTDACEFIAAERSELSRDVPGWVEPCERRDPRTRS